MRYHQILSMTLSFILAGLAYAEENKFSWGGDLFVAGDHVILADSQYDDIFVAANTILLRSQSTGDHFLAGNTIVMDAPVGGDLYAMGNGLIINEPVVGDGSLAGNTIDINAAITGDLRAAASMISIKAPVTGSVLIAADDFYLDAVLAGNTMMAVKTLSFGPNARINGQLTIYSDTGQFNVPSGVIDEQRIVWSNLDDFVPQEQHPKRSRGGMGHHVFSKLIQFGLLIVIAMALVAVLPLRTKNAMEYIQKHPWRCLGRGFLCWSFLFGAVVVSALTVVGIILIPIWLLLAFLAGALGYVMGCYLIGTRINQAMSWSGPTHWLQRLKVASMGALIVTLLSLIPFVGWWLVLGVSCLGQGAMLRNNSTSELQA